VRNDLIKLRFVGLIVLVFLLIVPPGKLICQEYPLREYGVRDGLPQSQANSVFQDSRGFIWILTRNGLSKFDGIEFVNYYRQDGLPSNSAFQLSEDSSGDLWILASEGISKYTGSGFKFYPPSEVPDRSEFFGSIAETGSPGKFYLLSKNRSDVRTRLLLFENGQYRNYSSLYPSLDTLKIVSITFDSAYSDLLIVDSLGSIYGWKNEKLEKLPVPGDMDIIYHRGKILLRNYDTLMELRNRVTIPFQFENSDERAEAVMVQTDSGPRVKYFDGSKSINVRPPIYSSGPYIDSQGTLWLPSDRNLFRLLSTSFTTITDDLIKQSNLWAICADNNLNIFIGSLEGNLFHYDGKNFRERNDYKKLFPEDVAFYKGSRLISNGELWISLNCGVLIWDGNKFSRLKGIPENTQVCIIYEDPDDHSVFLGTEKGVFKTDGTSIKCFPRFNENDLGVIEGIVKDDSGFYWMSGHRGLVKFDGINAEKVKDPVLPEAYTYTIEKDSYGGIWVSSDEGLFCKRKSESNFRHGLPALLNKPANVVKIIDKSHLMVGRGGDICLIDLERYYGEQKDYYRIYDKTDGFPGGDCLDNGIIGWRDGTFLVLTSDGIVRFDPGQLRKNLTPPQTMITGLFYENDSLSWEPVRKNEFYFGTPDGILLGRDQNKIKITYTGISTRNPEKVTYVYKLDGFEKKWSLPSDKREVIFDNLPHGQYTFLLKAINADGVENSDPVAMRFRIKPAIIETNIFIVLAVLFSVIFTILLTRYILKKSQQQREEKQKVSSELIKLQISAVLKELDPHFTFNAISSIGYLIMKSRKEEAYSYLAKLSSLLRTILYDGSTITRPLSEELDFVRNYCELQILRFEERFTYNISMGDNVELHREVPKMAIQIFVENSIKHGFVNRQSGGEIEIVVTREQSFMVIVIRDNGIGRAASMKLNTGGSGYGIKTVKRIFEITNHYNESKATVEIRDLADREAGTGTEVILRIPDDYLFTMGG
jgi:hypothetical protein